MMWDTLYIHIIFENILVSIVINKRGKNAGLLVTDETQLDNFSTSGILEQYL